MTTPPKKRRIAIVTTTRADWGLLSPVARLLKQRRDVDLRLIAANMHLIDAYGMTVNEIIADGFHVDACVPMPPADDSAAATAMAAATCLEGMTCALSQLHPQLLLVLGDRYELLPIVTAATIMRIPIAHISGGEITEGAIDDSIRHAVTKLSSLHFTATETYRQRVISMGERPATVFNAGALGVSNILDFTPMPKEQLQKQIGLDITSPTLLVTLHSTTMSATPAAEHAAMLLQALDRFPQAHIIFTYPNNDPDGASIIEAINAYAAANPMRAVVVPSLGRVRYLSALRHVDVVVGNSSSGVVEVPSMHIPTVDIGPRQRGRIAASSVIHCEFSVSEIANAIAFALSPEGRKIAAETVNPYYQPDTANLIASTLATYPLTDLLPKKFHDQNPLR